MLRDATARGVTNVARYYHHQTVQVGVGGGGRRHPGERPERARRHRGYHAALRDHDGVRGFAGGQHKHGY